MKLLAITDLHGDMGALEAALSKEKVDAILFTGDVSFSETAMARFMDRLGTLKETYGIEAFVVHGNHDNSTFMEFLADVHGVHFMHNTHTSFKGVSIIGYGGDGFSRERPGLDALSASLTDEILEERRIFLSHAPPRGTTLDMLDGHRVGDQSVRRFIEKHRPTLALSGHIHENFGAYDRIDESVLLNPSDRGSIISFDPLTIRKI